MKTLHRLTARQLSVFALGLWCCSLPLTGFVLYGGGRRFSGIEILAMGWLSPLILNVAWFANLFFLYGIYHLLRGGIPTKSAVSAAVLSLDTLRFSRMVLNEGWSISLIYGFGWGVVLWLLSIFMMLLAAGTRRRETHACTGWREWCQPLGIILSCITLVTASQFAIQDRMLANDSEAQRLVNIAFKRGPVCGIPEPTVTVPIRSLYGPVEVVKDTGPYGTYYPFSEITELLDWGIPTVRMDGADYRYETAGAQRVLVSVPAIGLPAAILLVEESERGSKKVTLTETNTNRTVFQQVWQREKLPVNHDFYCPDYHSSPKVEEQPRKLVMEALNIQTTNIKSGRQLQESQDFRAVDGRIIQWRDGGDIDALKSVPKSTADQDERPFINYRATFNTHCPADIGWDDQIHRVSLRIGPPFIVKGKGYHLQHYPHYNALCSDDSAYIYYGYPQRAKYYLNIEKRDLPGFRQVWAACIAIPDVSPGIRDDALKVQSVKPSTAGVTIELVNMASGEILVVEAPIHEQ